MWLPLFCFFKFSPPPVYQAGIPDPPAMSADLIRQKARERHFLEQLLDSKKLENYKIPVPIKAELRKYQQVCVSVFKLRCVSAMPPQAADEGCPICVCTFKQLLSCLFTSSLIILSDYFVKFRKDYLL